jgi:hypothetical protein
MSTGHDTTSQPAMSGAAAASTPTNSESGSDTKQNPKSNMSTHTLVMLPRSSSGHRIFVDGRVVGSGPEPVTVKCGRHSIKIGSAGKPRIKDLPCGSEITLPSN